MHVEYAPIAAITCFGKTSVLTVFSPCLVDVYFKIIQCHPFHFCLKRSSIPAAKYGWRRCMCNATGNLAWLKTTWPHGNVGACAWWPAANAMISRLYLEIPQIVIQCAYNALIKKKETSDEWHTWCWHCCVTAGIGPLFYKANDHKTKDLRTASHCHCVNRKTAKKKLLTCSRNVWLAYIRFFFKYQHTFSKSTSLQTRKAENLQLEEAADRPPPSDWVGPQQLERAPVQEEGGQIWSGFVDCMLENKGYWDVLSN